MEISCNKQITVGAVDEDYLEESHNGVPPLDADFVEGDNWLHDKNQTDHAPYLPDHAVIISTLILKSGDRKKIAKTLGHEFSEIIAESAGMDYDTAHETVANPVENEISKEIEEGDMPLTEGHSEKSIGKNIETEQGAGKPHDQAVAIGLNTARESLKKSSPEAREKIYKKHPYLRPKSDAK